jgi:hypothetical protein
MPQNPFYPIGLAGVPWTEKEKKQWQQRTIKSRSYQDNVVMEIKKLSTDFDIKQYGALTINPTAYPLYSLSSKKWNSKKPIILITGGVHGAIQFMTELTENYTDIFNIVTLPCVSPWGYEHIVRWNPYAIDPNRSFAKDSLSEEAAQLMQFVEKLSGKVLLHIDLHETTDSDESEFRPALAARDGENYIPGTIPDGFYLVGDTENKQMEFQAAIINAVKRVTHIAPADEKGEIIGSKAEDEGVIYYAVKQLGLCAGVTNAKYTTTTEVYPDSKKATADDCNQAQVTAIKAALDFLIVRYYQSNLK